MGLIGTARGYFRGGAMTEDKRAWVLGQIEGLRKANDELWRQAEVAQVRMACNDRQIRLLEGFLEGRGS